MKNLVADYEKKLTEYDAHMCKKDERCSMVENELRQRVQGNLITAQTRSLKVNDDEEKEKEDEKNTNLFFLLTSFFMSVVVVAVVVYLIILLRNLTLTHASRTNKFFFVHFFFLQYDTIMNLATGALEWGLYLKLV